MANEILKYTVDTEEIFEYIIKEDKFEFNHVVIRPGFTFPTHPTDANVIITIVSGRLSVGIAEEDKQVFGKGHVLRVDQGTMSTLGNDTDEPVELFVIKRR